MEWQCVFHLVIWLQYVLSWHLLTLRGKWNSELKASRCVSGALAKPLLFSAVQLQSYMMRVDTRRWRMTETLRMGSLFSLLRTPPGYLQQHLPELTRCQTPPRQSNLQLKNILWPVPWWAAASQQTSYRAICSQMVTPSPLPQTPLRQSNLQFKTALWPVP